MHVPFDRLSPAADTDHARWFVDAMADAHGVALVVPPGFESYARLLHPLEDETPWAAVAPGHLERGRGPLPYPFPELLQQVEGDMGRRLVDAITPALARATTTAEQCHFGLWAGWGELHAGSHSLLTSSSTSGGTRADAEHRRLGREQEQQEASLYAFVEACPIQPWWGGRDMLLFDGPIDAVRSIGVPSPFDDALRRRGPQWWWPEDRSWFVATEIDYPWTYVGGSSELMAGLERLDLEVVMIERSDAW